jgi:isoleucyl-tRNA synthetase
LQDKISPVKSKLQADDKNITKAYHNVNHELNARKMSKKYYPEVNPNPDFPAIEQEVLKSWKSDKTFEKSVEIRPALSADGKNNEFIFYDGPPFANGLPHYGHLLTGFVKDVFARYQTMQGKRVERRFGWDCHGLPAEMGSEKELGISGRAAIQNFGIDKFNEHCRENVMKYAGEWEDYVTRQARWVDFKNDYKTMDINFMESVLWAFKQLYDKGLVFEAHRVMPYSWAAETPLSNFETKLDNSYREREDKAIYVIFELVNGNGDINGNRIVHEKIGEKIEKVCFIAWTTTPWTLPSNLALAVSKDKVKYTYHYKDNVAYIATAGALDKIFGTNYSSVKNEVGKEFTGEQFIGLTYKPLFPYFADRATVIPSEVEGSLQNSINNNEKIPHMNVRDDKGAFRILDGSDFVTDGDGTGIVHIAPGFGEDDQRVAEKNGIELVVPVDGQGKFTDEIYDLPFSRHPRERGDLEPQSKSPEIPAQGGDDVLRLKGLNVIAEPGGSKFGLANDRIIDYLKSAGSLIKQETIKHNYPHCWRTDQPLIYRAMPSWYVEVTKFRDRAAELNQQINWIPEHIRDGQMGHMLKTAPDWSISRNRFWGTPIPVWRSKSGKIIVIGSIKELEELSGKKVKDLHRPYIDEITISKDGEEYTRVEDVFDCWFESGSMPFAQVHYPFENKDWFEKHFPADFITEYVGQTRGWFNTLIMLSTALFDKIPFRNCICHGVVLDAETGLKYSKRLKNYKDPFEVINQFGADALRWLMISSPVMRGQDLMVDPEGKFIRDVVRLAIKPIWNAYNFFTLYANADGVKGELVTLSEVEGSKIPRQAQDDRNIMDSYILAKCAQAVAQIEKSLDGYDTPSACEAVLQFFDALNNWYIRRSKERFWKSEHDADKQAAYDTLYTVLVTMCKAAAPLLPLTLEEIYKNLTGEESVHLATFPTCHPAFIAGSGKDQMPQQVRHDKVDVDIIRQMDYVREICNAALSIRNVENIRVRQPLKSLTIFGNMIEIDKLENIIKDEINVGNIIYKGQNADTKYKLEINFPVLGKRLPEKMKQIIPASKKGEWKQLENGVEIAGEILVLGEYSLKLIPTEQHSAVLADQYTYVVLDTTITPELEAEGIARDIVRMIQQARKDANLNVSDKIKLYLGADAKTAGAIQAHKNYIMEQTLTSELLQAAPASPVYSVENELDNSKITISFVKG